MDQYQLSFETQGEFQTLLQTVRSALAGDRASLALLAIAAPINAADRLATLTLLYDLERLVGLGSRSDHPSLRAALGRLRDRLETGAKPAGRDRMPSTTLVPQIAGAGVYSVPNDWRDLDLMARPEPGATDAEIHEAAFGSVPEQKSARPKVHRSAS